MTERKYTKELLEEAVAKSDSFNGVLRYLGTVGAGSNMHVKRMVKRFQIDYSHFTYANTRLAPHSNKRLEACQIFKILSEGSSRADVRLLRRALDEMGVPEQCNGCGLGSQWQGEFLRLEINHIDGNWLNNTFENLEYLCPNCHSQEVETNKPHKNRDK